MDGGTAIGKQRMRRIDWWAENRVFNNKSPIANHK
jgi:hypothetical protein